MDFQVLCEQVIIEENLAGDLYNIVSDVKNAKTAYQKQKTKDKSAALEQFNSERINLRNQLKNLIWSLPLNADGSKIESEKHLDDFVFSKEHKFPGIVLLHSTLLPKKN